MASKRPTTIAEYIRAAPSQAQPHLRGLYAILKSVAPKADEAIKWGNPFFVNPRFVFAFSAFKSYCVFVPSQSVLKKFQKELKDHGTTKNYLKLPYDEPLPEKLIRKLAKYRLEHMGDSDGFW